MDNQSGAKVAILLFYDRAIDEEVLEALTACCIEHYSRWHDLSGVGSTGPHLGDHIWPAMNNAMMSVVLEEQAEAVLQRVRQLQEQFPFTGLRAVVLPVLAMI